MKPEPINTSIIAITCLLMLPLCAFAQLPTPSYGWNLGNTLEATCGEGCWGPPATQALINSVASAGFNTIRIPCAWDTHANQSTYQIDPTYMARVKQVVDWCLATNLYVIINCHWDGGWLENNITGTVNPTITAKMNSYWTQIANTFTNYNSRLLFAAANEPNADTAAEMSTLLAYEQTFVNAVRATGSNNTSRWLVVQGPNTDIDLTDQLMNTLPTDTTTNRMMVEIHYYSPWNYTGMSQDEPWGNQFFYWGQGYHSTTDPAHNPTWGEEDYMEAEFLKMKNKFVDQGIPVIIGEMGTGKRTSQLSGAALDLHLRGRTYYHKTIVDKANSKGLKPFFWDIAGGTFNWTTGAEVDPDNINALTGGPALPPPGSKTTTTLSLTSDTNPSTYGNPVSFTATVRTNGIALTGISGETITFFNGATSLGTGTLNGSGQAGLTTSPTQLLAGVRSITVVYGGDSSYFASSNSPALSQTVTQAVLTAGLTGSVIKTYNGSKTATLAAGNYTLAGVVSGDSVALNNPTSGSYNNRNAGTGKTVIVSGLSISGASVANYVLATNAVSAAIGTINPTNMTVTAAANTKTYDGSTSNATLPTITSGAVQPSDSAAFTQSYADANAGTGKTLIPTGLVNDNNGGSNYNYTFVSSATGTINPAPATITSGVAANDKIYDGNTTATLNFTNVTLNGILAADTNNVTVSTSGHTATFVVPDVGTGISVTVTGLTLAGSAAGNYALNQPTGLNADILPLQTPTIISISGGSGNAQMTFNGQSGQNYRVLGSSDMTLPVEQWSELTNGTFGASPVTFTETFGDPRPTNRFYRIGSP